MKRTISLMLACSLAAFTTQAAVAAEDAYPRIGAYPISGPHDYWDPAYQKQLAKTAVSVINTYPGWGSGKMSLDTLAKNVKAINPNTKLLVYVIPESLSSPASSAWAELESKINSEHWWLYTGSAQVLSDFGHSMFVLNTSNQARKDKSGLSFGPWFANYVVGKFASPNPTLDGIYTDNVFWKPRRDGDWNGDGKIDSQNDPTVQGWYRQGYRDYADALKKAMPGKLIMANVADWGQSAAVLTQYQGVFNGGVLEGIVGESWSVENSGWSNMMASYRKTMAALAAPKLGIFQQYGNLNDYQAMRYGLASCLMDNGYYSFNDLAHQNYRVPWFDEFDAKLGAAVSQPATTAWQNGVYRRDFANGIALVNPKGNGAKEVTLEADFVRIKGTQDTGVNNGQTVRKLTLKDRDGIILMRAAPIKRPSAPAAVTIDSSGG